MKIRNGFVSNSSSSSFVIMGKSISISDIEDMKTRMKEGTIFAVGRERGEGIDIVKVNENIKYFKKYPQIIETFSYYMGMPFREETFRKEELINKIKNIPFDEIEIYEFDKSYHCSETEEDFKQIAKDME